MIISKIYNKLNREKKEDLVEGLVWGLVGGLVFGLVWGLVWGLVFGLVGGLVWGLVFGLVWGLVWGLVFGLVWGLVGGLVFGLVWELVGGLVIILINFKEALPFLVGFYPVLFLVIGIFALTELLFLLMPKEKLRKNVNVFWHTCLRNLECFLEVILGLSGIIQVYILIRELDKSFNQEVLEFVLKALGYVGIGIIAIIIVAGIFYLWIKLNSLKYKK